MTQEMQAALDEQLKHQMMAKTTRQEQSIDNETDRDIKVARLAILKQSRGNFLLEFVYFPCQPLLPRLLVIVILLLLLVC